MNARTGCRLCGVVLMCAAGAPAASQTTKAPKPKPQVVTLTGCVERAEGTPGQYTIEDKETGVKYRLSGTNVRAYVGQSVLIVGGATSKKLVITGGLTPTPNVAAQAGAMDPARAAVAAQGGSAGPGTVELPEFKVKSVRPGTGGCR
jgi:hypothetical protein